MPILFEKTIFIVKKVAAIISAKIRYQFHHNNILNCLLFNHFEKKARNIIYSANTTQLALDLSMGL